MSRASGGRSCYISAAGTEGVINQVRVSLNFCGTCFSNVTQLSNLSGIEELLQEA